MGEPSAVEPPVETSAEASAGSSVDPTDPSGRAAEDEAYRLAVIDLLGAIAYGELSAFERLVDDAQLAPTLADKMAIAAMAVQEFQHARRLLDRITELDGDPVEAMAPFEQPFDRFHAHTAPRDWLEGLVKAYVGDGLAADFYREIAAYLDPETRDIVIDSLEDTGQAGFVVERVRAAIEADHKVGGRMALWGRRLMGEALSQAQHVAAERDSLTALLAGGIDRPGMDLASLARMFARITERHTERMDALGLDS